LLAIRVWLGGEGTSELGGRIDGRDRAGVIEALLLRLEPIGWVVGGARLWKHIRKYRVGSALRGDSSHGDVQNVCGLALEASEAGCEVMAFVRDTDAEGDRRATAIALGIEAATQKFPMVVVIGGVARPAIEGWILALRGLRDTDAMSRDRTIEQLKALKIDVKTPEAYVEIVETADLGAIPPGCESLTDWLAIAQNRLGEAVHGKPPI
jgi:hypothetical protein